MSTKLGKIVADFSTTLATKILAGGTTLTLQSIVDDDGNNIPDGNYYFTLDGNNSSKEHIFCTIVGASVSAIYSVSRQGVIASGVAREHRIGAQVVITDFAHIARMNDLLSGTTDLDGSVPLKYDTNPTISNDKHLVTKKYVSDTITGFTGTATSSVAGTTKLSVDPASAGVPIAVGDNDPRVPTAAQVGYIPTSAQKDALAGTGTPSSSNKFVTADTNALNELLSHKVTSITGASDINYPSEKSVKTYVDARTSFSGAYTTNTSTTTQNIDTTFTTNFTARQITIYYWLLGTNDGGTNNYTIGYAVYNGTTLQANFKFIDNAASASLTPLTTVVDTTDPVAGSTNAANQGIKCTLTVQSVTATTVVIRQAFVADTNNTATAKFMITATV